MCAATFGWLCVETLYPQSLLAPLRAATFGWLCVETTLGGAMIANAAGSHLRVAVC